MSLGVGCWFSTDTLIQIDSRTGLSFILRAMWKSEHLLRIGIELGWLSIADFNNDNYESDYGTTNVFASLDAIPLMLVFDMYLWGIDFYTGLGYYKVMSKIDSFVETIRSSQWNVGYYVSIAYKFQIIENISLCSDVK